LEEEAGDVEEADYGYVVDSDEENSDEEEEEDRPWERRWGGTMGDGRHTSGRLR